uniref:Uncharacterized protein n=1 Tax=Rhizophora mucronata TaxID=61149 RepID=A0A2P2MZT7_RHIMU
MLLRALLMTEILDRKVTVS